MRTRSGALIATAAVIGSLSTMPMSHAAAASVAASKTTITSSVTSAAYDSWITFTATVTATGATPAGRVRFSDASTGNVLGSAALTAGKATFRTAALAPGARKVVAAYVGSASYTKSTSAPVTLSIGPGTGATGYQNDSAHDGDQPHVALDTSTLKRRWAVTPGTGGSSSSFSYPLVADSKVFVVGGSPNAIWALDARTGATVWFTTASCTIGLAYDGHQLFCLSSGGTLTNFDADSGHINWSEQLPGQYSFSAAPSARDGVVYASGAGSGGTVYAVTESDGTLRWTQGVENGDDSSPAVNEGGVFVSYACHQDYAFRLRGTLVWHDSGPCEGGGGTTVSLYGGNVYALGVAIGEPLVLAQSTGASEGTFSSTTVPTFGNGNMYLVDSNSLVAADPSGSPDRWVQGANVSSAPVADRNTVFVAQGNTVVGYSGSGTQVWSSPTVGSGSPVGSLAIGQGLLAASGGGVVAAFG